MFYRVGHRMGVKGLPDNYKDWVIMRIDHLQNNLQYSNFTKDLFNQYRKQLGIVRYRILLEAQTLIVPDKVRSLLKFRKTSLLKPVLGIYKLSRFVNANRLLKDLILPAAYKSEIKALDSVTSS